MPNAFGAQKREARHGSLSPPPTKRKFESTTTKKAVASFFTPVSQKEPERVTWRVVESSLLVGRYSPSPAPKSTPESATATEGGEGKEKGEPVVKRRKIAAFDFDSTLIQTSSGNIFGKNSSDWRWWHVSVPGVLRQLYADGYTVVVLSNQGGISLKSDPKTVKSDQKRLAEFKAKAGSVFAHLDIPIALYAGTARDRFRKPRIGMWGELLEDYDLNIGDGPDLQNSIFVGDAAGRPARPGRKADHSSSDRDFAANVGIAFQTPEEYFLKEPPEPFSRSFEPTLYLNATTDPSTSSPVVFEKKNSLDLVLLCGSPGAGKSTFYWQRLQPLGYERVNQDILKTRDRCRKVALDYLNSQKSVAIDNTNADVDTRAVWVQLAQRLGLPIRCLYFTAPIKLCEHNDTVRALHDGLLNPEKRSILPHSAFSSFSSRFREPQNDEGFQDIMQIAFEVIIADSHPKSHPPPRWLPPRAGRSGFADNVSQFDGDDGQKREWALYWI
ncbi:MAG: hypothetical protein Q9187_004323 [Circinaria calcarea]